jgi:hypothetical protein
MDKTKNQTDKKELNYVHKQTIYSENIAKERRFEMKNFKHEFSFSPFNCN